jgi:hypothetical protein
MERRTGGVLCAVSLFVVGCTGQIGGRGGSGGAAGIGGIGTGGGGGIGAPTITCDGSPIPGDTSGRPTCPPPQPPTQGCTSPRAAIARFPLTSTPALDAEVAAAIDPRKDVQLAYLATTEAIVAAGGNGPTGKCIIGKRIRVYQSTDLGATWSLMAGNDTLPQGRWATDPDISIGGDGTVYVSLQESAAATDCVTPPALGGAVPQVWVAAPTGPGGTQPGTLVPAFANGSPNIAAGSNVDLPQIVASPTRNGQFVIAFNDSADTFVSFQRNSTGTYDEVFRASLGSSNNFPTVTMDLNGDLYIGTSEPAVRRLSWDGSAWNLVNDSFPPVLGTYAHRAFPQIPSSQSAFMHPGPILGMTVTRLGGASDHILYVAFEVFDNSGTRFIEIVSTNTSNLDAWGSPTVAPMPTGGLFMFHPSLSSDFNNNLIDLLVYDMEGTAGGPLSGLQLKTYFYRFDAARLTPVLGPVQVGLAPPSFQDLPSRHSDVAGSLFPGEYVGIATKGLVAVAAYPELNTGFANVDLGRAQINQVCGQALTLVDPDNLWECTCVCGDDEFSFANVVGCATKSAATAVAACAQICPANVCGAALSCPFGRCSATSTGVKLSSGSCAVEDGPPAGAAPASTSDFRVASGAASNAVLHVAGQTSTTTLPGNVFMNVSSSPPAANAIGEIARFNVSPADVFVGGSVNAMIRNIKLVHRSRLRAVFTDATHFRIDPGLAEFVLTLQTQPSEGDLSDPINIRASNPTPIQGVLNLPTNSFSIDGTVLDTTTGDSLDIHFTGTVVSRPSDSDGDGIIDAVDKCPGSTPGPDRTAPVFTFVPPALTISSCTNVNIGQAQATDPCGVTITNNAPSTFPLGTTKVTWTARDAAGNVALATQLVTAVLGNSTSCCPVGSNIIMGTSNNNTITGTSGADCIFGLGGQDTINGGGGNDVISGGDGDDIINGQVGDDRLYGGSGQDAISGGLGNDFIDGGDGVDTLNGNEGADTLLGGQGTDVLRGDIGNDVIDGGPDDDQAFGGDGNDRIAGGPGNDRLNGEAGDDVIGGEAGDDNLNGGTGTNRLDGGLGHNICIDNGTTLLTCEAEGH